MGDKKGGGDPDEDPRLDFISEYLIKTMRLKSDKWPKMVGNEENRVSFFLSFFFLHKSDQTRCELHFYYFLFYFIFYFLDYNTGFS